ncbi:peptidoglycan/xylan/chitin deacetylase (PgdA/CDA1 family) [Paenibacillus endophyticus]|uniref:Peptidoglycan/xylan/chitin deacetylase (PgdA/CDA1 family) n=1 Tax=Paenibacillus endophyticus TaxID=1294268 RepID=A0A7W5C8N8_9BACL|nr:peptidoglycan/xylan/chitin deacetylase (PgdA/CDA1 family) [Paenibacillus endophyticus]
MKVQLNCFPGGRFKALTMSYDDGKEYDRRLVEIFNKHGIKGTFHLNSGNLGRDSFVSPEEISQLFSGHEISAHSVTHPFLDLCTKEQIIMEMMDDRRALERLARYPVRGMSYPYGTYNEEIISILATIGFRYARTTQKADNYNLPNQPLAWHPTCHHKEMLEQGEAFLNLSPPSWKIMPQLLYVWGHSYEFENDQNWQDIERFCQLIGGKPYIWYATNIEIIDYMDAVARLQFTLDNSVVHNPSSIAVWITAEGQPVEIAAGQTVQLD